jgi:predicted nucleotidyltransferase
MTKLAAKPEKRQDIIEVQYDASRWSLLEWLREKSFLLLSVLEHRQIFAIVHGSIARGDVKKGSDIDVFIPNPPSSFQIETALEQANILPVSRMVIQATPTYSMKAYIEVGEETTVSFPLMNMRRVEREFYKFSGELNLNQLKAKTRVHGIDKRLMFIEPTEKGHIESSIVGREEQFAKIIGVSVETISDRVRALTKRDNKGRTGVFVKKELSPDETFEQALMSLSKENPAVRRKLKSSK